MRLFVNKKILILSFIPIVLIIVIILYKNKFSINNTFISLLKDYFNSKNKIKNFSTILNYCDLENNSYLILYNNTKNLEFRFSSNITNILNQINYNNYGENTNYSSIKIPDLNSSINSTHIIPLKSGFSLFLFISNRTNNKYRIQLSIYKSYPKKKICSFFIKNLKNYLISCFEPKLNKIICLYISEQYPSGYLTKINITLFSFNGKNIIQQSNQFLKAFNYEIKNIQSILISKKEAALIIYKEKCIKELYLLKGFLKEEKYLKECKSYKNIDKKILNLKEKRKSFRIYEEGHKIFIEGHRGGINKYNENTILCFEEAIQNGIDSIELDVWLTKDNIPVVIHGLRNGILEEKKGDDKDIIKINNVSYDYIQKMNEKNQEKMIPTLEEVLTLCKNKIFINIELKDYQYELTFKIVSQLIAEKNMFNQIALSSFRLKYFSLINEFNKNNTIKIECGHIFQPYQTIKDITKTYGCSANVRVSELNEELIKEAHKHGIPVMAYFLKKDKENEEIYKKLIDYKVNVICCNYPERAIRFRDNYYLEKYNNSENV